MTLVIRTLTVPALLLFALGCDAAIDTDQTDTETDTDVSDDVETCEDLCTRASTAGVDESSCAAEYLAGEGYDLLAHQECAAIAGDEVGCNACFDDIGATDAECATIYSECF